jgi:signal transduction histidine kinase
MQAVGALAGGTAHELNNAILPIVMMSEDLVDDLAADPVAAQAASSILQAAQRAAAIVSQMLAFSETDVPEAAVHDLAVPAGEAVAFLRNTLPASITIESNVDPRTGASAIAPTALKQVIVNLAINARQAMQGKGTLRISLKPETVVQPRASHGMRLYPGRFARLHVIDDGAGMSAQVRESIFEPFFTTRAVGEGAGLGLSVVHGLVTQHDGTIFVDSEPGRGTQVDVYLPLVSHSEFKREVNGHDEHPAGG